MADFSTFNINGVDASIALATDTVAGLMSSDNYIELETLSVNTIVVEQELTRKANTRETVTCLSHDSSSISLITDENGNSAVLWSESGFDVNSISDHFKNLITDIKEINEDGVSLITNKMGMSAVSWTDDYGFRTNKTNYYTIEEIMTSHIKDIEEWQKLGSGMFIHWGVYSCLGGYFTGTNIFGESVIDDTATLGEWIMRQCYIPKDTYKSYQTQFTAEDWDTDEVVKIAYEAGLKYIVITAMHHDGFCLFDSDNAEWNVTTSSARSTILDELKESCEKYGLKFGIYISHITNWTATGGFGQEFYNATIDSSGNITLGDDPYTEEEHTEYCNRTTLVIKDIIDRFDPYILWYDGKSDTGVTLEQHNIFLNQRNLYYPTVITNDRMGHYNDGMDYATGEQSFYSGTYQYSENCFTTNNSWGYSIDNDTEENQSSGSIILKFMLIESRCRSQNVLINISPDGTGAISQHTKNSFKTISGFIRKYGDFENTLGTTNNCFPNFGRVLRKGRVLKCYVYTNESTIYVDGINTALVESIRVYDIDDEYSASNYSIISGYRIQINNIPVRTDGDYLPTVVDIYFNGDIISEEYSNILDDTVKELSALAFNTSDYCALVRIDTYDNYQIGNWTTNSGYCLTVFKYEGTTGEFSIEGISGTSDSGTHTYTFELTDSNGTIQSISAVRDAISTDKVTLTNSEIYTLKVTKVSSGGTWVNLQTVLFI